MDYNKIDNIKIEGIDFTDAPKFCDAFISSANYNGLEMTEKQLDDINNDTDFVYEAVQKYLY